MRNRLVARLVGALGSARNARLPPAGRTLVTATVCRGAPVAASALNYSAGAAAESANFAKWLLAAGLPAAVLLTQIPGVEAAEMERTFIAIKPDGVQRGLISEIISRFERKGYKLVAIKLTVPTKEFAEKHYDDLKERPFFNGLCEFLSSGPVVAMVWEGQGVIKYGRKLIGATSPQNSEPGTIRGDLAVVVGRNIIHGSDGPETAKAEISLWFKPEELTDYGLVSEKWLYGEN